MPNDPGSGKLIDFRIYITKLVLEWIRDIGGVDELERRNEVIFSWSFYFEIENPSEKLQLSLSFMPFLQKMRIYRVFF